MRYLKKRGSKKAKGSFLFIMIIIIAVLIVFAIASFIFTSKNLEIKKTLLDLVFSKPKQASGEGELSSISPTGETKTEAESKKTEGEKSNGSGGGGSSGGGGGSNGGGGGETLENESGVTETEEGVVSKGILEIVNSIDPPYTNHGVRLGHWPEASEGINDFDHIYGAMYNPSGVASKIVSKVDGKELDVDSRPENSTSMIYLELSLILQRGGTIKTSSSNELRLSMPLEGYNFGTKTITLQQYNPQNPNASYPFYDVREVISESNGVIRLPNLNGTYASATPYAYFKLSFS